ncbi:hypothetical protein N657DRAFT_642252 [Parathielavia appendiculata]|uniref:Uncharacterized protein n=1 Tax=Parathielavia appendiculata TaxID=2587402 RepID=A0AAN6U2Z8_9PEZI|nr:hypothetical protein N657DRAFT_642252 [Parathielavia appendiculata]
MSNSARPSRRQLYQLNGARAGWITLRNGNVIYVEYNNWTNTNTEFLPHLRAALEYIAARVAERSHETGHVFNHIQIRSMFHPTTLVDGERVMDPGGLHMTFDARAVLPNEVVAHDWRSGHAYIRGFPPTTRHADPDNFYHQVELDHISWRDGMVETSSGSSHGTTPRGGSPAGGSSGGSPRGGGSGSSEGKSDGSQSGSATKSGTLSNSSRLGSANKSSTVSGSSHSGSANKFGSKASGSQSGSTTKSGTLSNSSRLSSATKSSTVSGSSHSGSANKSGSKASSGRR